MMIRVVGLSVALLLALTPGASADVGLVSERGLRLCEQLGCFDFELIEIIDRVEVTVGVPGPPNPSAVRTEGIRVDIRVFDPQTGTYESKTYTGSIDPPDGVVAWNAVGGGGQYRGTVTSADGDACDLVLDWVSFGDGDAITYSVDADGAKVARRGEWPAAFYASSSACGLGGNSEPDAKGVTWEERALTAGY